MDGCSETARKHPWIAAVVTLLVWIAVWITIRTVAHGEFNLLKTTIRGAVLGVPFTAAYLYFKRKKGSAAS